MKEHTRIVTRWQGTLPREERYAVAEHTGTVNDVCPDGSLIVFSTKYGYLQVDADQAASA